MKWYSLKSPRGKLFPLALSTTKSGVWASGGFEAVCVNTEGFKDKYWKKFDASMKAAKKLGWSIVEVSLKEIR